MKSYIALAFLVGAVLAAPPPVPAGPQLQDVSGGSKPFLQQPPGHATPDCLDPQGFLPGQRLETEECVGTLRYCEEEIYVKAGEDFADSDECLRSRGKDPKANEETAVPQQQGVAVGGSKPFLQQPPGHATPDCLDPQGFLPGQRLETEECVGTLRYCEEEIYVKAGEDFADSDECLRSRGKDPKAI